jgi:hypothetical protein
LFGYLQRVVEVTLKMSRKPCSFTLEPSIVIVPVSSADVSVVVDLVVQLPETDVERVVVVVTAPTTVSCADTVAFVVPEHWRLCAAHVCIGISVEARVTEKSDPTVRLLPVGVHPYRSETKVIRPLLEMEYLKTSTQVSGVPLSFGKTDRFVSVQTCRLPLGEQVAEKLKKFVPEPPGVVSARTGPTTSNSINGTASNALANRRMTASPQRGGSGSPLARRGPGGHGTDRVS